MKNLLYRLLFSYSLLFAFNLNAQSDLPPGTSAPDWTATDIYGVTHDMSDMLASGKHVILEFSATWCGPCWSFHNTGTLETLYDMYGPDGTDQIRVFYIEASASTNEACLYGPAGCVGGTQGDWVSGHDFPFIHVEGSNGSSMFSDYGCSYYPTIYAVSGNGNNGVFEMYQQTNIGVWESMFFESFEMSLSYSAVDATCPGEGSIAMSATNGAGNITYNWSNGQSGAYIDGLSAGTYNVTATDENGYFLEETIVLSGPAEPLTADFVGIDDVSCFDGNNGAIFLDGAGGNGGYQFAWSNGDSGSTIGNLSAGTYTVSLTDAEGCTFSESYEVIEPEFLYLTNLPEGANCGSDDGSVVSFATGGVGPWTYDYGAGPNYTGTFDGVAPGDYVMSVTDNNGCFAEQSFSISATEGPDAVADAPDVIDCSTSEVTLLGTGSSEGDDISYAWNSTDGTIVSGANEINAVVGSAGTYTLEVTNSATGCVTSVSVDVVASIEAPITEIAQAGILDCNTSVTTLDGSGSSEGDNITYAWSTDGGNITSGASTPMAEVDAAGTYTLLTTNSDNGCTSSETVEVILDDVLPEITVADAELDCTITEMELCADVEAGLSVTWTTPEGDVDTTCITVSMAGDYLAKVIGDNGCEATATSVVTLSDDLPQVSIAEPEAITCTVNSVTINAEIEGDASDFNISWISPNGAEINTSDLSLEVDVAGQYTLTVSNASNGCVTTSSVIVDEIIINPESSFVTDLVDGTLLVESTSTGDPSTYVWSFGSSDSSTEVAFDETGTYEVCLTVTNDCGEDIYCEDVYFVSELLFEEAKIDALCYGMAVGMISVEPSGGEPDYSIAWTGPNGFTSSDLIITNLEAGEYNMVLNDNYGYEKTASYTISEPDALEQSLVEISDETNSDGNGSITLEIKGGTGVLSYEWSNGETTPTISNLIAGDYYVNVTDENGCTTEFGPFTVESTVGIDELEMVASISVFPIPANNYLNVNISLNAPQAMQLRVLDAYGKLISVQKFNTKEVKTQVDVSNLPAGVYYLDFGNENERSLEKFVVVK